MSTTKSVAKVLKLLCLTAGLAASGSWLAMAMVSTPGQFTVSETGAAIYSIPIKVPPGTAGMEPKLALVYHSQADDGLLGVGWSLSGLSAISRCGRTIVQDGLNVGVQYNSDDRFCLDGQRLVLFSGASYGAVGAEYRTERESFSKIVSRSGTQGDPGWFEVKTKAGQTLQFGATADSRIEAQGKTSARVWALNRIQDTKGNYLTVSYGNTLLPDGTLTNNENSPNGDFYPNRIDYTGNTGVAPYASVRFTPAARTDNQGIYVGGSLIRTMNRLTNVKAYVGENLVRDYRITYTYSTGDQASLISSVTEFAADGSFLPAISLEWQMATGTVGVGALTFWGTSSTGDNFDVGDINGDGLADRVYPSAGGGGYLCYELSTGSSFSAAVCQQVFWPTRPRGDSDFVPLKLVLGDVNGDGRADAVAANGMVGLATASGFAPLTSWGGSTPPAGDNFDAGDINGDGLSDLVYPSGGSLCYQLSTGNSFSAFVCQSGWPTRPSGDSDFVPLKLVLGDVNGDGRADAVASNGVVGPANIVTPNLVTTFSNGIGHTTTLIPKPLTDSSVYAQDTDAVWPVRDLKRQGPINVVSSVSVPNLVGGNIVTNYFYRGAKAHLHGRGFLGFRVTEATDQTGIKVTSTFRQDFPFAGLPLQVKRTQSSGSVLSEMNNLYDCKDFDGDACPGGAGKRYFPFVKQSDEKSYDLNGAFITSVRTTNQFDDFGNAWQVVVTHLTEGGSTDYSKTTTNIFTNDTANWFLGRLKSSTVASTTPP